MRSLYKSFLLLLFVLLIQEAYSQVNKTGVPFITNYSPLEFNFAEQNWSIVQDKRGLMYFGNNENGVLEYDGINFRKIPIPSNSNINSLAVDDNGIVFVGAAGEIGYLAPNNTGKLAYKSLLNLLDSTVNDIDVNTVLVKNNKVYFFMQGHIFIYDYHKIKHIVLDKTLLHWLSFKVNNTIYLGTHNGGLMQMDNNEVKTTRGGEFFKNKDITAIIPGKDKKIIIGTYYDGLYRDG
jgi:ligand-binding sensor domain-containing protein